MTLETTHKAKDGTLIPVEVSVRYFTVGGIPYALAVARDLTERKRTEDILKKSQERKMRNDLLNELVKDNRLVAGRVREIVRGAGIKTEGPVSCYQLMIDKWRGKPGAYWQKHIEELCSLQDSIIDKLDDQEEWVPWTSSEGVGVLQFGIPEGKEIREYQAECAERLRQKVERHVPEIELAIGIAEAATGMVELGARHRQSCIAVNLGRKIWPGRKIYHYLDLGVFQLIPYIEDRKQVAGYIERNLGKLLRYDTQKKNEYLFTLEAILESGNLKEAAKKVFVHHKTVELRKRRIEEILGVSLTCFETRMALAAALKLLKLDIDK